MWPILHACCTTTLLQSTVSHMLGYAEMGVALPFELAAMMVTVRYARDILDVLSLGKWNPNVTVAYLLDRIRIFWNVLVYFVVVRLRRGAWKRCCCCLLEIKSRTGFFQSCPWCEGWPLSKCFQHFFSHGPIPQIASWSFMASMTSMTFVSSCWLNEEHNGLHTDKENNLTNNNWYISTVHELCCSRTLSWTMKTWSH